MKKEQNSNSNLVLNLLIAVCAMTAMACANNGGSDSNQQVATTPQSCNIPGQPATACNPGYYLDQGSPYGIYPYPYTNNGVCGCGPGFRSIYNQAWGIACAPISIFNSGYNYGGGYSYGYAYFNWGSFAQNQGWVNIPQANYNPAISGNLNCNVGVACDTRNPNSCTNGAACRPIGGGSAMGLCTSGRGEDNYNYNPQFNYGYGYGYSGGFGWNSGIRR